MALTKSITQAIGAPTYLDGLDGAMFGTFTAFDTISEPVRSHVFLNGLPTEPHYDVVAGHFTLSTLRARYGDMPVVTIMREPRCRLISQYLYLRAQPEHELTPLGDFAKWMHFARGPLADYLMNPLLACQIDNLFTRFLLYPNADIPQDDFISPQLHERLYQQAVARLEHFGFVDVLENPALERNLQQWLGCEFHMLTDNVTVPRLDFPVSLPEQLTMDVLARLRCLGAIDRRLWLLTARRVHAFQDAEAHADDVFSRYVARQAAHLAAFFVPRRTAA